MNRATRASTLSSPASLPLVDALGFREATETAVIAARLARLASVASVWPFVLVAQLAAIAFPLGRAARAGEAVWVAALDAVIVLAVALLAWALLALHPLRDWPAHHRTRALTLCAAVLGAAMLSLLWSAAVAARIAAPTPDLVALAGAIGLTGLALQSVRPAVLGFGAGLVAMLALLAGAVPGLGIAFGFLVALGIATVRLARIDHRDEQARAETASGGELARRLVHGVEQHGSGWFWETDRHGRLTYLSAKVAGELAEDGTDPVGRLLTDVFRMDSDAPDTERTLAFHLSSRTSFSDYSVCAAFALRDERWWSISGRPSTDALGRFQGFIGSGSDLTEKRRAEAEITRLALFDSLTGLANRQRMRLSLDKTLAQGAGPYRATSLFLLDLDRFKAVNDTLGHQTGDALLQQVAQRLQRAVGDKGLVGRLGGDEFKVVLPGEDRSDTLAELARTVIGALSQPYFIGGHSVSIGCSIGIAVAPRDGGDSDTLVRNADLALYAAKGDGRGVHRFFSDEMLVGAQTRKQLEDDLRTALTEGAFHLAYQPVVSTRDARIVGYEALLRWNHPVRGAVSPADFVPIAEECGLIEAIGEWVLRTACDEASRWPGGVRVAVNVSPIQFANPALPTIVTGALARSGLAPGRLELEITEGVFLNESAASEKMFRALKGIGVRLALDDFGTGYSSLGYLRSAPFDKIKIDQSFVRGAAVPGNRNAAIVKAIVTLADTLGMETTAEGVEVQDEIALLRDLGCSHIQGYVYGRPARSGEVLRQLGVEGGVAAASGHKVSRSARTTTLRSARLVIGDAQGDVRIRNISPTGAMIDGIDISGNAVGMDVMIEVADDQMVRATLRWAHRGKAGLAFAERVSLDRLGQGARGIRRSA